jgi:hypothetical protein
MIAEPSPLTPRISPEALLPDIAWTPELEDIWLNETGHYAMEVVPEKPAWEAEE